MRDTRCVRVGAHRAYAIEERGSALAFLSILFTSPSTRPSALLNNSQQSPAGVSSAAFVYFIHQCRASLPKNRRPLLLLRERAVWHPSSRLLVHRRMQL